MDSTVPRVSILSDQPVRILLQYPSTLDLLHTLRSFLDEGTIAVKTPIELPGEGSFTATFEVEGECRDLLVTLVGSRGPTHWLQPLLSPQDFGYLLETLGLNLDTFKLRKTLETCESPVVVAGGHRLEPAADDDEIVYEPDSADEPGEETEKDSAKPRPPNESSAGRLERLQGLFEQQKRKRGQLNKLQQAEPSEQAQPREPAESRDESVDGVARRKADSRLEDRKPEPSSQNKAAPTPAAQQAEPAEGVESDPGVEFLASILDKMNDSDLGQSGDTAKDRGPTGLHPAIREALETGDMSAVSMSRFLNPAEITVWIRDHYSGLKTQNHFEFLNVHWTASRKELRKAILDARWTIAPEIIKGLGTELEEMAADVGAHLQLVEDTLMPQAERTHYRRSVVTPFEFDQAIAFLRQRIDSARYLKDTATLKALFAEVNELDPAAGPRMRAEIREQIEKQKKARAKGEG